MTTDEQRRDELAQTLQQTLADHALFLREIYRELRRRPERFGAIAQLRGLVLQENKRGVVRCITNPTAIDLNVTLYDGSNANGSPKFSAVLAPGESRFLFLDFKSGLYSVCDNAGATIDGELDS